MAEPERFTKHGKQVLLDGKHYADAVDEQAAATIARVLELHSWKGTVDAAGNIISANGDRFATGTIWLRDEEQALAAERHGWRRTGSKTADGMVMMARSLPFSQTADQLAWNQPR